MDVVIIAGITAFLGLVVGYMIGSVDGFRAGRTQGRMEWWPSVMRRDNEQGE